MKQPLSPTQLILAALAAGQPCPCQHPSTHLRVLLTHLRVPKLQPGGNQTLRVHLIEHLYFIIGEMEAQGLEISLP